MHKTTDGRPERASLSRRRFLQTVSATAAALGGQKLAQAQEAKAPAGGETRPSGCGRLARPSSFTASRRLFSAILVSQATNDPGP